MSTLRTYRLLSVVSRTPSYSRFYASSASTSGVSHGEEHQEPPNEELPKEGFTGKAWRNSLILVAIGIVWYNVDKYFVRSRESKHPITAWIESAMIPETENIRRSSEHTSLVKEEAKDKRLFGEAQLPPIYRFRFPEQFDKASPFMKELGNEVDLSDLVVRND
ncbi:3658_t:CDS:2 [Paraglomus occultum]|uniref:3658_t:CDS:1 n=1 Tax=Paraglomus occultum TaxID=144539 RepID=A0A9N8WHW6_9GLOM|nr:3658_t:CDS:2 [Paraglomus occultum]